jgi:3-deoxy-7-phosphoheptulonate synthase
MELMGNLKIAIDAIQASGRPHHFLSVHKNGQVAMVQSRWNLLCHVILRWGKDPNYKQEDIKLACEALKKAGLPETLMVDCSHGNSQKDYHNQPIVAANIAEQLCNGEDRIFWVMLESHIKEGAQKFTPGENDPKALDPNQSITDACIGWDQTVETLGILSQSVTERRRKN